MKSLGIKYQLRLTTLIPVLLVAILFAVFYNGQFSRDLEEHMARLGEAYVHQLLPAAQLAILRDNHRTLQGLVEASTINPEVKALAFYNAKRQILAYRGGKHAVDNTFTPPQFTGNYIESTQVDPYTIKLIAPVTVPKFNLYSSMPFIPLISPIASQADDILGWISMDIDTRSIIIQRYQMYIITIFITILGLLMSLSIHFFLSKRIYLPLSRLRRSMKQILRNEFETEIKAMSGGELGVIEQGCVHLQQRYLSTIQDINQHIEVATTDLQQSLELLEEKNIELLLDKKKTEEKNRQKSELIANMSHEIRTPMTGVIGFANVLMDSKLDPLQLDYVKTIKSSAQDLLNLINDILDYSKMDAGKLQLDCIPIDIRACIDEVLTLIAPTAYKKEIDLIPITDTHVPKVMLGDPLRLKQMISNLVSNAVKFTDSGHILIRTSIESESDKEYDIVISITDTGIGISAEQQATLFSAFNQGDTTIARRYGGSGLGLVICKKLAEHMQGRIAIRSEVHKGSTFSIHIKLEKLMNYEVEKHQTHRFAHLKVICFDENSLHLDTLCNGLAFWGIKCTRIEVFTQLTSAFNQYHDIAFIGMSTTIETHLASILYEQSTPCVLVSKGPVHAFATLPCLFKPLSIQKLHDTIESIITNTTPAKIDHTQSDLEILRKKVQQCGLSVLVAEDNAVNRLLLKSMLSHSTIVETVNDGAEAVEQCKKNRYHLIILDIQMPHIGGLEAAHLIHTNCRPNITTPIILISAKNFEADSKQLRESGVYLCLEKPVNEKTLLQHLIDLNEKSLYDLPFCIT